MKLLIIEDNELIAEALHQGLRTNYSVDIAKTGRQGLEQVAATKYDLILLDLNLPDMAGKEICANLRSQNISVPIMVLTGSSSVNDKVAMLDSGADDYLTKPFSLEEVRARVRAVLRRSANNTEPNLILEVGMLKLDSAKREFWRNGDPIHLRRKEFDILEYLMTQPGKTLSRAMIVSHIWDMSDNLWANVVDVHIKHLRDKIDRPFKSQMIQTVHGVGYKLEVLPSE